MRDSSELKNIVRIVPPPLPEAMPGQTQFAVTRGTRVYAKDGVEIHGIQRIELVGDIDDVWKAKIFCLSAPPEITCCLADIEYRRFDLESIARAIHSVLGAEPWDSDGSNGCRRCYMDAADAACQAIRKSQGIE